MIDSFSLLATTSVIIFVVWRASIQDKLTPWFGKAQQEPPAEPELGAAPGWRRRMPVDNRRAAAAQDVSRGWRRPR